MRNTFSTTDMDAIRRQHEEWCRANDVDPNGPTGIEMAMKLLASYKPERRQARQERDSTV